MKKLKAEAVLEVGGGWAVKVQSKPGTKWFTIADCYLNPLVGNAKETAEIIARALNTLDEKRENTKGKHE
jgi:hypothetical protein